MAEEIVVDTESTVVETQTSADIVADPTKLYHDNSEILDRIKAVTTSEGVGKSDALIGGFDIEVESLVISDETLELGINQGYELTVTYDPETAMKGKLYWESSDITIATVCSCCGKVYTLAEGETTIKVTYLDGVNNKTAECVITVNNSSAPVEDEDPTDESMSE